MKFMNLEEMLFNAVDFATGYSSGQVHQSLYDYDYLYFTTINDIANKENKINTNHQMHIESNIKQND